MLTVLTTILITKNPNRSIESGGSGQTATIESHFKRVGELKVAPGGQMAQKDFDLMML